MARSADESARAAAPRHGRYTIYKPLRSGKGAALQFELNPDAPAIFVEGAHQEPGEQKRFAWSRKIVMKWGLADIGQALAVLERRQVEAKLFHQTQKGNSVFELKYNADREPPGYFVTLSRQQADTKDVDRLGVGVNAGEAAVLASLLRHAVIVLAGWDAPRRAEVQ